MTFVIPDSKKGTSLEQAETKWRRFEDQYEKVLSPGERYNKVVDIWSRARDREPIRDDGGNQLGDFSKTDKGGTKPVRSTRFIMADSGARGSPQQIKQLAGMRGLMAKPSGEIIETPITANFREGLSVLQYFISTHGARKGLADTALKTANAGYLTPSFADARKIASLLTTTAARSTRRGPRRLLKKAAKSSSELAIASWAAFRSTTLWIRTAAM